MSTLHVVNKSPFERNALKSCIAHLDDGDAVLLIEDAVVAARSGGSLAPLMQEAMRKAAVYVLGEDLAARAVKTEDVIAGTKLVDYSGFVALAVEHNRTHSWL